MKVLVDSQNHALGAPCGTLSSCLAAIEKSLADRQRVITRVVLDGRDIGPEDEKSLKDFPTQKIELLEVSSESPGELVYQGLDDGVREFIPQMRTVIHGLIQHLRAHRLSSANDLLSKLSEFMGWMITIASHLPRTHAQYLHSLEGGMVGKKIGHLQAISKEMANHQQGEDWVSLADLLEFELLELVNYFEEIFKKLCEIREQPNG